ncbi:DUF2231 domain-containing protein [Hydrogenophaga sp.]|uniref:DUF2231 domain-containing protein n=1 Tax=Hydrogenophaga sp. TaxID=1904254 RepID=UPI0025BFAB67|nr:DUF2231 domain-containing protein [Hydrogenophaga sp.]MBT9463253.1 DUF2231 domain-containing protein [Hydrogenophaga sp.]
MNRTVNLVGHSLFQMVVMFTAGLLLSSVLVDMAAILWNARIFQLAYWLLGLGLLGGLVAAPLGWLDWRHNPRGTRAHRVGALHGVGMAVAVGLFALSWFLRGAGEPPPVSALSLSLLGGVTMLGTAWLGRPNADTDADAASFLASVAGEEDPGAAVDAPAPPPETSVDPPARERRS